MIIDDLRSGDSVMDGDELRLSVRTSTDAYLYLAFCSPQTAPSQYHGLSVFPEKSGIRLIANQTVIVPSKKKGITLDNKPGRETLYLIASRAELSYSDSGLADVIAAARQGKDTVDCGAPLRSAMAGPSKTYKPRRGWSRGTRGSTDSTPPPAAGRVKPPGRAANTQPDRPNVEIERGGALVLQEGAQPGVENDLDEIVILRYELNHEPAPPERSQSAMPASR